MFAFELLLVFSHSVSESRLAMFIFWLIPQEYSFSQKIKNICMINIKHSMCFQFVIHWVSQSRYSLVYILAYASGTLFVLNVVFVNLK